MQIVFGHFLLWVSMNCTSATHQGIQGPKENTLVCSSSPVHFRWAKWAMCTLSGVQSQSPGREKKGIHWGFLGGGNNEKQTVTTAMRKENYDSTWTNRDTTIFYRDVTRDVLNIGLYSL